MSTGRFLLIILVSFACTFFLRALPFLAFSGERKMPSWMERLSHALPPAIMAVLVVYCLKSVPEEWVPRRTVPAAGRCRNGARA